MTQTVVSNEIDVLIDALKTLGNGALLSETASNVKKVIAAVSQTNKTANLSIRITIKPDANSSGEIVVYGSNTISLPKEPVRARFYVDKDMLPVRDIPGQLTFEFNK